MSVIPFRRKTPTPPPPEPEKQPPAPDPIDTTMRAFLDLFGDITVGEALEQLSEMPLKDALTALSQGFGTVRIGDIT